MYNKILTGSGFQDWLKQKTPFFEERGFYKEGLVSTFVTQY